MRNHAEILRDLAANFDIIDSIGESIFILFHRLGKFSLFLRIDAAIEQFDRIIGHRLGVLFSARRLCLSPCGLRNRKLCGKRTIRLGRSVGRSALRTNRQSGNHAEKNCCRGGAVADRTLRESKPDQHQQKGDSKRIAETIDWFCCFNALIILRSKSANPFFERVQARISGGRTDIDSAGPFCQRTERGLVQRTVHNIPLIIFQRFESAVSIGDLNDGRLGGIADSGDEERDLPGDDFIDGFSAVALQFVAIGNEHHRAMLRFRRFECLQSRFQGRLNVGASDRNGAGGKLIDRLKETGFIGSQRTFQKGASGEGNQSETIAWIAFHQLPDQPFRMGKTGGLNIFCQHGF